VAEVVGQLVEDGPGLAEGEDLDGQFSDSLCTRDSIGAHSELLGGSLEAEGLADSGGLVLNAELGLLGDLGSATHKLADDDLGHDAVSFAWVVQGWPQGPLPS